MVKYVRFASFIAAITWLIGFVLLSLKWYTYAKIPLYVGSFVFAFICLPLLYLSRRKGLPKTRDHIQWFSGMIGVGLFVISTWLKAAHIQGAPVVLIQAYLLITFVFLPLFFLSLYKRSIESI